VAVEGLTVRPATLLDPLSRRIAALAGDRRYEEAALVRDRAAALAGALRRQRRLDALRSSGRVGLVMPDGELAELHNGILVRAEAAPADHAEPLPFDVGRPAVRGTANAQEPCPAELAAELVTVAAWLDREAHRVRLEACDGTLASPWPAVPSFATGQRLAAPHRSAA
jgi:DNA polymerase-3 subunit epsilon